MHDGIIHCGYHKAGWSWWRKTLRDFASQVGRPFVEHSEGVDMPTWIYNDYSDWPRRSLEGADTTPIRIIHQCVDIDTSVYRATQMIRDPRDVAVSGYFYHIWTEERWCTRTPIENGRSHQQRLKAVDMEEGLNREIATVTTAVVKAMVAFKHYDDPAVMCVRYEDLIFRWQDAFRAAFKHYGCTDDEVELGVELATSHHFVTASGRALGEEAPRRHCRQGTPGDWKRHFSPSNKAFFKELMGDDLITLGYAKNNDW